MTGIKLPMTDLLAAVLVWFSKIEPLVEAINWARKDRPNLRVILLSPQGRLFNQSLAVELAALDNLMLICGHYEGVDDRVQGYIDDEISWGTSF